MLKYYNNFYEVPTCLKQISALESCPWANSLCDADVPHGPPLSEHLPIRCFTALVLVSHPRNDKRAQRIVRRRRRLSNCLGCLCVLLNRVFTTDTEDISHHQQAVPCSVGLGDDPGKKSWWWLKRVSHDPINQGKDDHMLIWINKELHNVWYINMYTECTRSEWWARFYPWSNSMSAWLTITRQSIDKRC